MNVSSDIIFAVVAVVVMAVFSRGYCYNISIKLLFLLLVLPGGHIIIVMMIVYHKQHATCIPDQKL